MFPFLQSRKPTQIPAVYFWTLLTLMLAVGSVRAQNDPPQRLRGHLPAAIQRLTPLGKEDEADPLHLAIGLPLRNQEELTNLLQQIYDPANPNFHHYLTPEEFTEKFGPTEDDYQAVIRFAKRNGLSVTATHPNRVVLDVEGTVADVEKSLHVVMRNYQHPREARLFHAPDTEPTLDLAVPILHISGLDDYSLPHPNVRAKPMTLGGNATPQSGSGPGGTYRGNDFREAYSVGPLTGAGQSVGLLQFDGYYAADIATYESQAGLPGITLTNVSIDGGVSTPGSGVGEVSLDIEMVMSMAPGVSRIIVYEAPNPSPWVDLLSRMANDNLAKQLSCSWGGGPPDPTSEQVFKQMAAQGQSFFNATGDSDAFTGAIDFPSDSTNITQVGGTTLTTTGPGGSYVSETVWNWGLDQGSYVGSSGGVSTTYTIPPYQQGIDMTANQGSITMRNVPDVALTGDNVYVVYNNGGTGSFGGTSCAAPLWAGFMAVVNQQAALGGHAPMGFLNPALYAIGKSNANYASIFHDITTGNNFSSSSPDKYSAVPGYDLCTGWGTPNGTNLINTLTPLVFVPQVVAAGSALVAEGCLPTNGVIDSGETVTVNFDLQNIGSINTTNLVATLLATNGVGLPSGPQNYGALAAGGASVSRPFSFTALNPCGSNITATFQLQDGATNLGTVTFNFSLGGLAVGYVENFEEVFTPTLPGGWTTSSGGGQSGWVTTSAASDSAPNAVFTSAAASIGSNALVTASIPLIAGSPAQLSFRNNYNLEARTFDTTTAYDGGVLEIKIGSGSFADILAAGGSFIAGGYNRTISSSFGNPLRGRQAWSGNSSGFISTIVNLPAAASGQSIQLRWRVGADASVASTGWYIDSIAISNITCCSGSAPNTPPTISTISNVITSENISAGPIGFTIGDAETAPSLLTLSASSSDTNLIDAAHIVFGGSGASRTVTLNSFTNHYGASTITLIVSDGSASTNTSFALTVNEVNHAASLAGIPDFVLFEEETLSFTNKAADVDQPAQTLTYSLSNAPAGAGIGASSGVFSWTPTEAQGPSTNPMTIFVTDNGTPPLSTAQSFNVIVLESNEPPVLAPIADHVIHAGMTLAITNSATDPDLPENSLTYTLDPGPAGADINLTNGVLLWTPDSSFANSTNTITVVVTDDNPWAANAQHLSDAKSFSVFVAPPPTFSSATMSDGTMTLTWSSIAGQTYRVQFTTNLGDVNWTDLTPDITASDVTASQSVSTTPDGQRFYRILVLP